VNKEKLRKRLMTQRDSIPRTEKELLDAAIASHLYSWEMFISSRVLFCFVSFKSEVDTFSLIETSLKLGKTVSVPRVNLNSNRMESCVINDLTSSLAPGYYGILEPVDSCVPVDYGAIDLIITPGLAFTPRGERLGYGGGFYDRFLENHVQASSCALTYDRFVLDELPVKDHDLPVDYVITESGVKSALQEML
jgi:5-formyltetrahydrofolate cyclo-ligase